MAILKTGIKAPKFSLPNQSGEIFSLKDIDAKHFVVYFYPKDMTPGCTIEAEEFTKHIKAFKKLGAEIIGISGGDADSKMKFCKKHNLKIILLADEDFAVSKKFNAYGDKIFIGNKFKGILRKTYVINNTGKIVKIYDSVSPKGHAEEVLDFLLGIGKKQEKRRDKKLRDKPKKDKRLSMR